MKNFDKRISYFRDLLDSNLKKIYKQGPQSLVDPINYVLSGVGKRFRPILTMIIADINNVPIKEVLYPAISIEMLHNFTLIHDDIMDKDTMRHGQKTIHAKWDKSAAILAGDGIFVLSQIILSSIPKNSNEIFSHFNKATLEICEGQALDKEFENNNKIKEEQYLDMIDKKTGALLSISSTLGPIYNGVDHNLIKYYNNFGRSLGKGFQLHDDLLEITSNQEKMGKTLGSDLAQGKQTMMVIKARNSFPNEWNDIIEKSNETELISNCKKFFIEKGILEITRLLADSYFKDARDNLKNIKNINTDELFKFIDLLEKRTF